MPARPDEQNIQVVRVGMTEPLEGHRDFAGVARQTGDRDPRGVGRADPAVRNADKGRVG